jgi:hypothetical protein
MPENYAETIADVMAVVKTGDLSKIRKSIEIYAGIKVTRAVSDARHDAYIDGYSDGYNDGYTDATEIRERMDEWASYDR